LGRVYASATGEHKVSVVDTKTLKIIAKTGPVKYPDGMAYAPGEKRVFVSDEHGDTDAVIDATTNSLVTAIPLEAARAIPSLTQALATSSLPSTKRTNS
jgi:DNA-binding beta-propeller fold protein YncE